MNAVNPDRSLLWSALLSMQRLSWEQGVASHAAIDAGDLPLAKALAADAVRRADEKGRLGATGDSGLVNGGSLAEAVALLARDASDPSAAAALEAQRWWLLRYSPRDDEGVVWHLEGHEEVWVDSIYMVIPCLALTGDFAPADMQYRMHREHLFNAETGLYSHRANTVTGLKVAARPWGSGNGWAAAGIARALSIGGEKTPAEMRARWQSQTRELLVACGLLSREDGAFHDTLDDPSTFTDATAGLMLAYAAFTGVADGWLDPTFAADADRWLGASLADVDSRGFVRGACAPPHFDKPGESAEAQAFALLALSARDRAAGA